MLANATSNLAAANANSGVTSSTILQTDSVSNNDLALVQEVTPRQMGTLTFREPANESLLITPSASEKKTSSMLSDDDYSAASNFDPTSRVSIMS